MRSRYLIPLLALSLAVNVYLFLELERMRSVSQAQPEVNEPSTLPEPLFPSGVTCPFIRVVDGDTLTVGVGGDIEYVRLIGIDAPEPNDPGGPECYATESTAHLTKLLQTGTVRLFFDESQGLRDKYSRLLAYVELPDGTDVGYAMLRNGYAREYLYATPYARRDAYLEAESQAVAQQAGLWDVTRCAR